MVKHFDIDDQCITSVQSILPRKECTRSHLRPLCAYHDLWWCYSKGCQPGQAGGGNASPGRADQANCVYGSFTWKDWFGCDLLSNYSDQNNPPPYQQNMLFLGTTWDWVQPIYNNFIMLHPTSPQSKVEMLIYDVAGSMVQPFGGNLKGSKRKAPEAGGLGTRGCFWCNWFSTRIAMHIRVPHNSIMILYPK